MDELDAGPFRFFYVQRCYRYERPQMGRYREFTQFGVEIMSRRPRNYAAEAKELLVKCADALGVNYEFVPSVKRGIS